MDDKVNELLKRIEELERKVRELELRPPQQIHYHYTTPPQPIPTQLIQPWQPWWGTTTCGTKVSVGSKFEDFEAGHSRITNGY